MSAGKYNLSIEQGAIYGVEFTCVSDDGTVWNLTDYTAQLQIRDKVGGEVYYDSKIYEDIVIDGPAGTIFMSIPTLRTSLLDFDKAVYDLELKKNNEVIRILEGSVYLSKEVTHNDN